MAGNKAAASAESLVPLVAVEPVEHNGKLFSPGGSFSATKAQAEALLAMGAAQHADKAQAEAAPAADAQDSPAQANLA